MANSAGTMRSPRKKSSRFKNYTHPLLSETVIYHAAQALGRGFDVSTDFRLGLVKGAVGSHLVDLDEENNQNLVTPTGLVIHDVPKDIRLDKGERTRFKSDVLSFNQMSERFNQGASLLGKMPLGLFNTMYGFNGPWQGDENATKSLALDGWFLTLYSLHLTKSPLLLIDEVKEAIPNVWEPKALASFIKKYGTHIIVGLKVGGKNVVYVRQHHSSPLQLTEVARLTEMYADERFQTQPDIPATFVAREKAGKKKVSDSYARTKSAHLLYTKPTYNTTRVKSKDRVVDNEVPSKTLNSPSILVLYTPILKGKQICTVPRLNNAEWNSSQKRVISYLPQKELVSSMAADVEKVKVVRYPLHIALEDHSDLDLPKRMKSSVGVQRMLLVADVEIICRRRGGDDTVENHYDWIATVADSPDVISMSFVPISSILDGVSGVGFLSYAINLYLRYRPPVEELEYFLEFQLPKQWSPMNELSLGCRQKESPSPAMQFSLMGPKLYVSTSQVSVSRKPVTGLRLSLEGKKCNKLAIHLQHLSSLPRILQPYWDTHVSIGATMWKEPDKEDSRWFEPVLWKSFSHVSTCPVECSESWIGATGTFIVTGAQLQVWDFGVKKKVLFLRLLYTKVPGCSIRMSQWDHTPAPAGKSGFLYNLGLSGPLQRPGQSPNNFVHNDDLATCPASPKNSVANPRLLKIVDMSEMSKGPQDMPGHWLVSGAKLDVETGKIAVRVKYSLLHYEGDLVRSGSSSS